MAGEGGDVHPVVAGDVELEFAGVDEEEGWFGFSISDNVAQHREGVAQILTGAALRESGPQQVGEMFAVVRSIAFDGEVGEQGADFVVGEACDGGFVQGYGEGSE